MPRTSSACSSEFESAKSTGGTPAALAPVGRDQRQDAIDERSRIDGDVEGGKHDHDEEEDDLDDVEADRRRRADQALGVVDVAVYEVLDRVPHLARPRIDQVA